MHIHVSECTTFTYAILRPALLRTCAALLLRTYYGASHTTWIDPTPIEQGQLGV